MSLNASPLDVLIHRIRDEAAWSSPASRGAQDDIGDGGPMRLESTAPVEEQVRRPPSRMQVSAFFLIENNEDFVRFAYRTVLLRAPDPEGFEACCRRLAEGGSRAGVICSLRNSNEGKLAAARLDSLELAQFAWLIERILRTLRLRRLARWVARAADRWIAGHRSEDAEAAQERVGADLAVLRLIERWRAPLETHAGRTAVLEREVRHLRDTVRSLETDAQQLRSELDYVRQLSASLATAAGADRANAPNPTTPSEPPLSNVELDAYYLAFEDANRGSKQEFLAKLSVYGGLFESLQAPGQGPLLDIGCGRGELLDHLREMGIAVQGVDTNPVMVALCRERGHTVSHADALERLRSQPDNSLGAVSGFHIIEHLPFETLFNLVRECWRVLQPNGFILFETPNPENILVGSHTFYHDFTHRNPVTPTAVQFLAHYHGFTALEIIRSSPYPESAKVPGDDLLTRRVNGHLCGPQDYALLARKPDTVQATEPK